MPNRVPAVRYTAARRSSMRTLSLSEGVSWRTLMGYPSYARNRACALHSSPALPLRNGQDSARGTAGRTC